MYLQEFELIGRETTPCKLYIEYKKFTTAIIPIGLDIRPTTTIELLDAIVKFKNSKLTIIAIKFEFNVNNLLQEDK